MADLKRLASLPEVKSAVRGDLTGAFLGALRHPDGEAAAAVAGFLATTLGQVGEELGLGGLTRISFEGPARACLLVLQDGTVTSTFLEPATALPAVEKLLDAPTQVA
jgi:hypothetical protein